ncbi:MAG: glycosyl hydrolase [Cyclobacteriaceae bacterium]|nr:glycosyl hydrolase [Cyclobacteriaceae bacterium]
MSQCRSQEKHTFTGKRLLAPNRLPPLDPIGATSCGTDQKSFFDHEICAGLNRMYFHTFTSSPPEMELPGQEYFAGTHVNPQLTWWEQSGPFIDYMHRTQSVVQEGKFMADVYSIITATMYPMYFRISMLIWPE